MDEFVTWHRAVQGQAEAARHQRRRTPGESRMRKAAFTPLHVEAFWMPTPQRLDAAILAGRLKVRPIGRQPPRVEGSVGAAREPTSSKCGCNRLAVPSAWLGTTGDDAATPVLRSRPVTPVRTLTWWRRPIHTSRGPRPRPPAQSCKEIDAATQCQRWRSGGWCTPLGLRYRVDAKPLADLNRRADLAFRSAVSSRSLLTAATGTAARSTGHNRAPTPSTGTTRSTATPRVIATPTWALISRPAG